MRIIKFRAWDKQNNKWIDPSIMSIRLDGVATSLSWENANSPDQIILVQFTGLHDKNGKEIFEGDIFHYINANYYVYWDDEKYRWMVQDIDTEESYSLGALTEESGNSFVETPIELIGNIYENPELLK